MTNNFYDPLNKIDSSVLASVARQSLELPDFHLIDWSAQPLDHEKVIETTGGLFLFRGRGWDGKRMLPWSAVLKIVQQPGDDCLEPGGLCYWKREALAYQSGLLAELPASVRDLAAGVRAPRCYGVMERADDGTHSAWIWLEHLKETGSLAWSLVQFRVAARRLGAFAGAYLTGRPVPDTPWLCASLFHGMLDYGGWWARFINPASPRNAWQRPLVQAVYPDPLRERVLRIWAEKEQFIAANERLPRVFCHNDAHRHNLILPAENDPLLVLDWGFCGPGGLGNDLGELIGGSLSHFAGDAARGNAADAPELEAAVLEGYTAGLRDAGWSGDERLARLGYLISLALYWGATLPHAIAQAQPDEAMGNAETRLGRPVEELLPGWTRLASFALDRADEARAWMQHLL